MSEFLTHLMTLLNTHEALPFMFVLGFVVWMLSTAVGGGGPVLFLPALTFFAPIREIAPITSVTAGIVSVHRMKLFRGHINWRVLIWLMPGSAIGVTVGVHIFLSIDEKWLIPLLAAFLIFNSVAMMIPQYHHKIQVRSWHFLPAGLFFSGVSAVVGAAGQGINTLFLNSETSKEEMIATKSVNALLVQTIKIAGYIYIVEIGRHVLLLGFVAGCGAMFGNYAGKWILARISEQYFRRVTASMLFLSGLLILSRLLKLD